ncbi:MAG TPA: hypothetical protein VI432_03025 [Candidatus Paceibacterota bacterium]
MAKEEWMPIKEKELFALRNVFEELRGARPYFDRLPPVVQDRLNRVLEGVLDPKRRERIRLGIRAECDCPEPGSPDGSTFGRCSFCGGILKLKMVQARL